MTNLYNYDKNTKEYINTTIAKPDPIDGIDRIPANATTVAPMNVVEDQSACWNGTNWVVKEDHRGKDFWISGVQPEPETVDWIGAMPSDKFLTKPSLTDEETSADIRLRRDAHLETSDKNAFPDRITDAWVAYRQALRDVPSQAGFPHSITWPTAPE